MYDIIIIGAGPAGLTAALYARRAEKSVLVLEKSTFGGQITHSPRVENYPCFIQMTGTELADKLTEQVLAQGAEIELDTAKSITGEPGNYTVTGDFSEYKAKAVIIAGGSAHRKLNLNNEDKFTGEGISYCAVCDGAFYKDKNVAVIGGGNSALQEAVMLSDICSHVTVIQNLSFLTGEEKLINDINGRSNIEIIYSSAVTEIIGEDSFRGIVIENAQTHEKLELLLDGIFVAIGQKPENEPFADIVHLSEQGYIESDETCKPKSSPEGIFAAGDCRTKAVRQVTTATADGAVAALAACRFIDTLKGESANK